VGNRNELIITYYNILSRDANVTDRQTSCSWHKRPAHVALVSSDNTFTVGFARDFSQVSTYNSERFETIYAGRLC